LIAYARDLTGPGDALEYPQIYLISVDGEAGQRVTEMEQGACQPAWSPDGKRLAFISPCASNQEIYDRSSIFIINADGSGLTPLPTTLGGDFDPAWSPDGTRIAFTSLRDSGRAQIYVINLEDNTVQPISNNFFRDFQPSWSPDGEKLAFVSSRLDNKVWTINSDGSGEPGLFTRSGDLKNSHPVWFPDEQRILFTQRMDLSSIPRLAAGYEDEEGTYTEYQISSDIKPRREGTFSPDGQWIAYEGWPEGDNHDIFIMTLNGLDDHRITDDPAYDFDAAWQPNQGIP
jgi:Tol biopolymer transport system component